MVPILRPNFAHSRSATLLRCKATSFRPGERKLKAARFTALRLYVSIGAHLRSLEAIGSRMLSAIEELRADKEDQ
jgi:hypothetical protein